MIVEVRLYAGLHKYVNDAGSGEPFPVILNQNSTYAELLAILGIPEKEAFVTMVNGQASLLSVVLRDGDRIGVFPAIGGG